MTRPLIDLTRGLVAQFNFFLEEKGLLGMVQADYICIKCSSALVYEERRKEYEADSRFIYQAITGGRRVSFIGLAKKIPTKAGDMNYLELSDQKEDGSQDDRIDHIGIFPTNVSREELLSKLREQGVAVQEIVRPHHTSYDIKLESGFIIRISSESLLEKIKREEMV